VNDPLILAALLLATALLIAGAAALLTRRRGVGALGALILGAVLATTLAVALEALGQPKPLAFETPACRPGPKAEVLWGLAHEPVDIEILVATPCGDRLYVLPYTAEQAQQLQDAQRAAGPKGRDGTVRMGKARPGLGDDGDLRFYGEPQPPPPPKDAG
jgi:hypothetical protein